MAQFQPIGEALRKRAGKSLNRPTLSEQHVTEAGQLWGVTASELSISADYRTRKICLLKEDG